MNQQPLVSVIIPTYSRPDNIVRAIDSVLKQTYKNIEIIVVDDNGERTPCQIETEKVLREYIDNGKITYIKHEVNKNGSAARNTGFRASHGEYVNFLDDDDYFMPEKIEKQVEILRNVDDNVGATYCNCCRKQVLYGKKVSQITNNLHSGRILKEYLSCVCQFNTSSILFRRFSIVKIKGFDESWRRHQDYELMVRFFRFFSIECTGPEVLMVFDNTSNRISAPNGKATYELEDKFLSSFKDDLINANAYKEVSSNLWYGCMRTCCMDGDFQTFKKSYRRYREVACMTPKKILVLTFLLIMRLINVSNT